MKQDAFTVIGYLIKNNMKKKKHTFTPSKATLEKYKDLGRILARKRKNFCGVGTKIAKLIINNFKTMPCVAYRLALEIEDVNIQAKQYHDWRQKHFYKIKEKLIWELCQLCETYGCVYGSRKSGGLTKTIVFFELPDMEQISWHTKGKFAEKIPPYLIPWDGKVNSTMDKLERVICKHYGDYFLKSATKNNKPGAKNRIQRLYREYNQHMCEYLEWKQGVAEYYRKAKEAANECTKKFKDSTLYTTLSKLYKDPEWLGLAVVGVELDGTTKYRVTYEGKRIYAKVKNISESPNMDVEFKGLLGILRTTDPDIIVGEGVEKSKNIAFELNKGLAENYTIDFNLDKNEKNPQSIMDEPHATITDKDGRKLMVSLKRMHENTFTGYGCMLAVVMRKFDRIYQMRSSKFTTPSSGNWKKYNMMNYLTDANIRENSNVNINKNQKLCVC